MALARQSCCIGTTFFGARCCSSCHQACLPRALSSIRTFARGTQAVVNAARVSANCSTIWKSTTACVVMLPNGAELASVQGPGAGKRDGSSTTTASRSSSKSSRQRHRHRQTSDNANRHHGGGRLPSASLIRKAIPIDVMQLVARTGSHCPVSHQQQMQLRQTALALPLLPARHLCRLTPIPARLQTGYGVLLVDRSVLPMRFNWMLTDWCWRLFSFVLAIPSDRQPAATALHHHRVSTTLNWDLHLCCRVYICHKSLRYCLF